jgi:hypothetical protein
MNKHGVDDVMIRAISDVHGIPALVWECRSCEAHGRFEHYREYVSTIVETVAHTEWIVKTS